jgi:acyl-coenzyme A thioesterase PaaI-like protein
VLHGGVYCSIVEAVASYGPTPRAPGQKGVLASERDGLLPLAQRGRLRCRPAAHSGRSRTSEVKVTRTTDGKLVARGQVRFHVLDAVPGERFAGKSE